LFQGGDAAYFKILGILFGLTALLKPVVFHLIPWDEHAFFQKACFARRLVWTLFFLSRGFVMERSGRPVAKGYGP